MLKPFPDFDRLKELADRCEAGRPLTDEQRSLFSSLVVAFNHYLKLAKEHHDRFARVYANSLLAPSQPKKFTSPRWLTTHGES